VSNGPWQCLEWKAAHGSILFTKKITDHTLPVSNSLRRLVADYGVPHVAGSTPIEEALVLLRAGAEVEHALLVQYLYAAWSLGSNPIANQILVIAIQEMCHFITVQNLLLFLGAMPSISRQDQDPAPTLDPFPFTLRPFSLQVLEDFLLTEMPAVADMTADEQAIMKPIIHQHSKLGNVVHPVGLIYAKLYWLLQEDDLPTADWPQVASSGFEPGRHLTNFPGIATAATFQVDPQQERKWNAGQDRGGVFEKVDTRVAALRAVFDITVQGEGVATSSDDRSHFAQFIDIYKATDFGTLPSTNWPTDPFVSAQAATSASREANRITNPAAIALSRLLDLRYRIALASIRASLSRDRTKPADLAIRTKYVAWAFDEMLGFIKGLSFGMSTIPCKAGAGALVAAPTFNLDGFSLPDDAAGLDAALASLHTDAASAIQDASASGLDASTQDLVDQMGQVDQARFPALVA
jgi:hypothetical protein